MSTEQIKKIAKDFIDSQKHILEEFGDSAVASKLKEETISAEKTFHNLCCKPKASVRRLIAGAGHHA